ncbi:MAG: hypothetical protein K9G34_11960, partial [Melioribacteraceae bacterium]|nr:hypothetical protein [Melioribacteraceae bacterium]
MNIRSIYKIILFLFISSLGFGQSLSFINYTVESHGLAQNSVFSIFQDSRGFIWFATEGGLSKFDGSEFRNYDEGLIDKDILSISEDSKGAIWVGTTKNLTKIVNDTITNYTIRGQVVNSFSDAPDDDFDFVYDIVEDSNNTYFFTTRNNGVFTIDSMGFRPYEILADVKYTREFIIDQGHGLWITTEGNGVYSVKGDELTNYRTSDGLISDSTWSILELENGEIVIGCVDGYTVFKDNKFVQPKNVPSYMNDRISAIVEDKDGNLWFGTYNNGLVFYDGYEYQNYGRENGLPNDVVYSAIEDLRGDLWIGMQDGGAARLAVEKFKVYSSKNGLAADNIFSILRDSGGDLWFGHLGEGISRMTDDGVELYNTENGFLDNGIPTMIESQNGDIWIGTMSGLARYRNDKFKYYDQSDSLFSSLFVLSLLEDSQGKLWVGGEGGIKIYDPTTDKFIEEPRLREIYSDNPEIWVTNIYEDNNGFIWFSTSDKGVFQYNGRTVKRIGVENGLPSPYVFQVIQTPDNTFWFCTDQGLVRYVDQKATVITSSQGLSNNTCYFALSEKDYLYIGTGNGISRLAYLDFESKGKDAFKIYNNRDGIAASEMNMFAFHKDKNNNLYFGSKNGVTSFNPNDVPRFLPSNVYIKKITISDDESDKDTLTNIELELDYTQDNLTIEYQAIVFTSQEKIRYQIRLDPLDNRPSETQISEA